MRSENRDGEGECYQVSHGVQAVYNDERKELESLMINGAPVDPAKTYRIGLQGYHASQSESYLHITQDDLRASGQSIVIAKSV